MNIDREIFGVSVPKGAGVELRAYIEQFSDAQIFDLSPDTEYDITKKEELIGDIGIDKDEEWQTELSELLADIEGVRKVLFNKEEFVKSGFSQLYKDTEKAIRIEALKADKNIYMDQSKFASEVYLIFLKSHMVYGNAGSRPVKMTNKNGTKQYQYERREGCLTPRQIRVAIREYGLDANPKMSLGVISKQEGIAIAKGFNTGVTNRLAKIIVQNSNGQNGI